MSRPARRVIMTAYYRYILQNKGIQKNLSKSSKSAQVEKDSLIPQLLLYIIINN